MEPKTQTRSDTGRYKEGEEALVEAARSDPEAFAALYRHYLAPLYRYLFRRSNSAHDAEDLTNQVFTEALEGLVAGRYREGRCFAAWLFTIARRRLVDFYRQRPTSPLGDPPSPEPGLMAAVEKGEDLQRLARLLARLDEERQELLRLRFSAGLSFAEIGLLEGRSEAAVKMALYRALDTLRELWEDEDG
jgi:RNA polymerase sigma-70 factor, ECF subfamily